MAHVTIADGGQLRTEHDRFAIERVRGGRLYGGNFGFGPGPCQYSCQTNDRCNDENRHTHRPMLGQENASSLSPCARLFCRSAPAANSGFCRCFAFIKQYLLRGDSVLGNIYGKQQTASGSTPQCLEGGVRREA
jgi:hypothetical protein